MIERRIQTRAEEHRKAIAAAPDEPITAGHFGPYRGLMPSRFLYRQKQVDIEFDRAKSEANERRRGLPFSMVAEFDFESALIRKDLRRALRRRPLDRSRSDRRARVRGGLHLASRPFAGHQLSKGQCERE
jgi:hypothetical protein